VKLTIATTRVRRRKAALSALLVAAWVVCSLPGVAQSISSLPVGDTVTQAGQGFVGDAACLSCHKEISERYRETAHRFTSSLPSRSSIGGSFSSGKNTLQTSNPDLHFLMTESDRGSYQTAITNGDDKKTVERTERFDLVIGSDRKGQSYLFWQGDSLFQLPVSYWAELGQWINSPGYQDGSARFDRPVVGRCLECHSSYFEVIAPGVNQYKKEGMRLGITCERCHGPGAAHIALNRANPHLAHGSPQAIVNPIHLPRDRQIDSCALCHAGLGLPVAPAFSFGPGDVLDDFIFIHKPDADEKIDVHGNQVEPLKRSRCFRESAMTCSTCHDVHTTQRDAASFSQKCLTCHKAEACGKFAALGPSIAKDCVSCHMPLQESQTLIAYSKGGQLKPKVRNHQIAIYPDAQ